MKKWSEIKQATLDKLFLTIDEADDQGYLSKFRYLANECLNIIANGVKPRIVAHKLTVASEGLLDYLKSKYTIVEGSDFRYDIRLGFVIYNQDGIGAELIPENNVVYYDKVHRKAYLFEEDSLKQIYKYNVGDVITMPEDFISFADMLILHNGAPYDDVVYLGDKSVTVGELGEYVIYYNGTWHNITDMDVIDDNDLKIDISVLNCLPTYIASQCLAQDDVQRSAMLKNEFELMLSRLDTNIMYQNNHFRSSGGWY